MYYFSVILKIQVTAFLIEVLKHHTITTIKKIIVNLSRSY